MKPLFFKSEFTFIGPINKLVSLGMICGFTYVLLDSVLYTLIAATLVILYIFLSEKNGIYLGDDSIMLQSGLGGKKITIYSIEDLAKVSYRHLLSTSYANYRLVFYFEKDGISNKYESFTSDKKKVNQLADYLDQHEIEYFEDY